MKQKFNVIGMACSACSSHVEKAVNNIEGVINVSVNLLTNSMLVDYDETKTNSDQIITAVVEAGYNANVAEQAQEDKKKQSNIEADTKNMKSRLLVSILFLIPLMYLAMYHMLKEWIGLPIPNFMNQLFHGNENAMVYILTQFLLLLPIALVNQKYFRLGFKNLFKRHPNMDSLIAIGSTASILYGIFVMYKIAYGLGHGDMQIIEQYHMDIYFESAGTILTLITVGKYLETKAKGKTSEAIEKLIHLVPDTAIVLINEKEVEVLTKDIKQGDMVLVKPGQKIPIDGTVVEGATSVDESAITGESMPVSKKEGSFVIGATINKTGSIQIKAEKVGEDTTLSQIIKLVEEANSSKAPIAKLADKISGVFVPIVITIALLSFAIWMMVGASFEFAISIAIAILVISCPCALGLATPVAIMVGTGKGAENGILIKSGEALEMLHQIDTIVLDKTGTITKGVPEVTDIFVTKSKKEEVLKVWSSLESHSEHPLAEAVVKKAQEEGITQNKVEQFQSVTGKGISGEIEEVLYYTGKDGFLEENNILIEGVWKEKEVEWEKQGKTVIYLATKSEVIGLLAIADEVKESSQEAIQKMKQMHMQVVMLTGDKKITAQYIQEKIGIPELIAEVLPQKKEEEVRRIQQTGKKVAMIGDGINDSPALARADVGIAIGAGTDIAIESADIILMRNDLLDVVSAIQLSKAVMKNIKENLFWAFFYNIVGIPIAAGVFFTIWGLKLNPMIAAAAMSLSSVCVVLNALRLKRWHRK